MSTSPVNQPPSPCKRQNSLPKRQNSVPKRQSSMSPMKRRENATPFTVTDDTPSPSRGHRALGTLLQMVNISLLAYCLYRLQFSEPPSPTLEPAQRTDEIKLGVSLSSWDIAAASNLNKKPYTPPRFESCQLHSVGGNARDSAAPAAWSFCADHLPRNSTVYSFGDGGDVSFHVEMLRRGHRVFSFDPSLKVADAEHKLKPKYERLLGRFWHMQVGLGRENGVVPFPADAATKGVPGHEAPVLTLQTLLVALGQDHIDLLKIGARGAELDFCTTPEFLESLAKVGQVILRTSEDKVQQAQCMKLLGQRGFRHVEFTGSGQHVFARVTKTGKVTRSGRRTFLR